MRFYLIALVISVFSGYVQTEKHDIYKIDPLYPVHDLQKELKVFRDSTGSLSPEKVKNNQTKNYIKGNNLPRFLQVGEIYWGKVSFIALDKIDDWTLQFQDKMIGPPAWTKSNGKVDVYAYANDDLLFHRKTGVEYSSNERDTDAHWVLNQISLTGLPTNEIITLVIRAEGNSLGYPAYFNLSIRSPDQPYYHQIYHFSNSFNIFMFGVTFIVLLYHLLLYFYLRENVFLWFSVWLLFCTLTHAMTIGLILGSFISFRFAIWMIIANGVFYSFWFFGREFINSNKKYPRLDKFMIGLPVVLMVEILATTLYVLFFDAQPFFTNIGYHYVILNIYTICSLILSIILVTKKDLLTVYFGVGSIIASIFLMLGTLWSMGILKPLPNFIDPFATGMFLQIIIYSFGIAFRQQVLAKKAQNERLLAEHAQAEVKRISDLDKIKTRFFANISHEFRTPLTLLRGTLNQIVKKSKIESDEEIVLQQKEHHVMNRSTERLQTLVDQLLDLSKLESGTEHLILTKGNIIAYLRSVIFSFESMAERQNISLNTSFPKEDYQVYFDKDKIEKIITNILSNAFKYTPGNGIVSVILDQSDDFISLEISDTGKGISDKNLKHIFDRFYREEGNEEKGSGIGLALAKELIELHNGKINVTSIKNEGSTFKLKIPCSLDTLPKDISIVENNNSIEKLEPEKQQSHQQENFSNNVIDFNGDDSNKKTVLLIEDNEDLRNFVSEILMSHYTVLKAIDGAQGERMAFEHIPDIIVSDIMMPKMDGYELCRSLKTNVKTSHIPIIMLTAKAHQNHKIEGLSQGADGYLVKPFNEDELLIRMRNLLESREKLWNYFKSLDMLLVDDVDASSIDDKFLQAVFKVIKENIDNEHFGVDQIAREVGFSRSQLHRKLKALLNKTASQLVIEIRLNEAMRRLRQKAGSVSEIAYAVGYTNLSYFSKSFKEKFGMLPSKVE